MGYLPHTGGLSKTPHLIVVDAVLTEQGRFRLAEGAGKFNITKFALGDDEIDYSLYDTSQPTENQDDVIMLTPVLEAVPDAAVGIRHFLYTAPAPDDGYSLIPTMEATPSSLAIEEGSTGVVTATTNNPGGTPDELYTATFVDNNATKAFKLNNAKSYSGDDSFVKVWTFAASPANKVNIEIQSKNMVTNPDQPGTPLNDTDVFTYQLQIRGTSTGLTKTVGVQWFRQAQGNIGV